MKEKDTLIQKRIEEWSSAPFDADTITEIKALVHDRKEKELEDRFYTTLEFGTGGLRGIIGAGTNRMNIYTVGMATQGLANYIKKMGGQDKGVVIARDSRRFSDIFAKEAASILAANAINVYMFEKITPTPFASFAVRELGAVSGIVITASHNPPEYNGYKVYWEDGGQIIPPHDSGIIEEVKKITLINQIKKADYETERKGGRITPVDDQIFNSYIKKLEQVALRSPGESDVKIAYTPLHGTGCEIIPRTLKHFGFSRVAAEPKQSVPDGDFPTVSSPNPEERAALKLVLELGKREGADIVLATDPDADRMGVAFKDRTGGYVLINGNQIGTMLETYLLTRAQEAGRLSEKAAVIKTIVTTELQQEVAAGFDCKIENVLTGFKWIAAKIKEYDETGQASFLFGGEESYGYLPVSFVRDKDAVSACYFFAEMTDWLQKKGMTLQDFLDDIYISHRLYLEDLRSLTLKGIDGIEKIANIMSSIRKAPPAEFSGIPVKEFADYKELVKREPVSGKEESITGIPSSNVLQFFCEDGTKITMRPSGTEPKIKFYFSVCEKVTAESLDTEKKKLRQKLDTLIKELMERVEGL